LDNVTCKRERLRNHDSVVTRVKKWPNSSRVPVKRKNRQKDL